MARANLDAGSVHVRALDQAMIDRISPPTELKPGTQEYFEDRFNAAFGMGSYRAALKIAGEAGCEFPNEAIWVERQVYCNVKIGRPDAALSLMNDQRDRLRSRLERPFILRRTRKTLKRHIQRLDRGTDYVIGIENKPAANDNNGSQKARKQTG